MTSGKSPESAAYCTNKKRHIEPSFFLFGTEPIPELWIRHKCTSRVTVAIKQMLTTLFDSLDVFAVLILTYQPVITIKNVCCYQCCGAEPVLLRLQVKNIGSEKQLVKIVIFVLQVRRSRIWIRDLKKKAPESTEGGSAKQRENLRRFC